MGYWARVAMALAGVAGFFAMAAGSVAMQDGSFGGDASGEVIAAEPSHVRAEAAIPARRDGLDGALDKPSDLPPVVRVLPPVQHVASVPDRQTQTLLVKRAIHDFAVSVSRRDMRWFHASLSQHWQRRAAPAQLDAEFKAVTGRGLDLLGLDPVAPVFTHDPRLSGTGRLILQGYEPLEADRFHFCQIFLLEKGEWKLVSFQVEVRPAPLLLPRVDDYEPI